MQTLYLIKLSLPVIICIVNLFTLRKLELRQYKNDSTKVKNWLALKLYTYHTAMLIALFKKWLKTSIRGFSKIFICAWKVGCQILVHYIRNGWMVYFERYCTKDRILCMYFGGNHELYSNDFINIFQSSGRKMMIVCFLLNQIVYYLVSETYIHRDAYVLGQGFWLFPRCQAHLEKNFFNMKCSLITKLQ